MSEVVQVLRGAAEVIETYGWTRRTMGNEREGYCLLGAMLRASGLPSNVAPHRIRNHPMWYACQEVLATMRTSMSSYVPKDQSSPSIVAYVNDNYLGGGQQALSILRRTIQRIENGAIGDPKRTIESVPEKTPIKAPEPVKVPEKVPAKVMYQDEVTYYYNDAPIPEWASFSVTKLNLTEIEKVLTNA